MRSLLISLALAAGLVVPVGAQEAQRIVPDGRPIIQLSFAPIVKRVVPAVVNVYARRVERQQPNPIFDDPFFQNFFGGGLAMPRERVQRSLGSGVIVDSAGLVVTNNHVIQGANEVKVVLADKREFDADIVLRDPRADLAVLRLKSPPRDLVTLPIADDETLQVGDLVLAVGNPFGVGQTVTSGIVSALARATGGNTDFQSFIQTDAAINPGNSGGALVDMRGRLVGINTAIFSRSGGSIGIGFAVPAAMVRVVIASAESGRETVARPYIGASFQNVSAEIAETLGLDRPVGALVTDVIEGGPGADAGLRRGDVVVAIDGVAVSDPDDFGYRFATKPLGGTTLLTVRRGARDRDLEVALAAAPETTPQDEVRLDGPSPLAGATVVNLSPAVAEQLGMPAGLDGVVVTAVDEASNAGSVGLRPGDIVVSVNGARMRDTEGLAAAVAERSRLWRITINRGGRRLSWVFSG